LIAVVVASRVMPEQFQCPEDGCGFVARTDEYDEAIARGGRHLEQQHDEDVDESDLEKYVASVSST